MAEGKIGPQFGKLGGRPRKPRASEMVAEAARKDADKIIRVFQDGLDDDSIKTRITAANSYLGWEHEEAKLKLEEEKHDLDIEDASRDDLIGFLANALTGSLGEQVISAIPGTAEDITDAEVVGRGPSTSNGDGG